MLPQSGSRGSADQCQRNCLFPHFYLCECSTYYQVELELCQKKKKSVLECGDNALQTIKVIKNRKLGCCL